MHSPALIAPLSANIFWNNGAANVPNNILKNRPFISFASFLSLKLTPIINTLDYSRDSIIFMIPFVSSLEKIKVVAPDSSIFLWIITCVADATAVNPNCINPNELGLFLTVNNLGVGKISPHASSQLNQLKLSICVVLHKIFHKYQNGNQDHVAFFMTPSYFKRVIEIKHFYE